MSSAKDESCFFRLSLQIIAFMICFLSVLLFPSCDNIKQFNAAALLSINFLASKLLESKLMLSVTVFNLLTKLSMLIKKMFARDVHLHVTRHATMIHNVNLQHLFCTK